MSHTHRFAFLAVLVAALLALVVVGLYTFKGPEALQSVAEEIRETVASTTNNSSADAAEPSLFATMLAFNTNEGLRGLPNGPELLTEGWSAIIADDNNLQSFLGEMKRRFAENISLVKSTGFTSNRDVVGAFVWNVIEPTKGTYDWTVTDLTVQSAAKAGQTLSAVLQPFAAWDQTIDEAEYRQDCSAIDFGYYDFKAGQVNDWEAFDAFVSAVVERYDGDGVDDMPGLKTRVEAWEIGNEIDGECGGFGGDPAGYVELLSRAYGVIKAADPQAIVLNGGALEVLGFDGQPTQRIGDFWKSFFALGGDQYLDVFNFHHNHERNRADDSPDRWEKTLIFFNELMESSDGRKPLWVTEFGTYAGTPSAPSRDGRQENLPTQSEAFQASWYFRYSVIGFANGLERVFIDLQGDDKVGIGASSYFNEGPGKDGQARAFLATLQGVNELLVGFDGVEQIGEGQYLFEVDGRDIYALWDGALPSDLANASTLMVMGLGGEVISQSVNDVQFSEESPVLIYRQ